MLRIAWCGPEAAATVHALTQAAFAPYGSLKPPSTALRETVEIVRTDLEQARGLVAHLDELPVAAARTLTLDNHLHLRRLAVHPDYQRRGLATAVMHWVQDQAISLGYEEIRLGARNALPANRALYENLGYRAVMDHGFWTEFRLDLRPYSPNGPQR